MSAFDLILYSRKGCCICEGLEARLQKLSLHNLKPPLELHIIDIDSSDIPHCERSRYDLHVPVLVLKLEELEKTIQFPRVSPRLDEAGLSHWLQKELQKLMLSN